MPKLMELTRATTDFWEFEGRGGCGPLDSKWTRDDIVETVNRVNRGALLLDRENPGWEQKIAPGSVVMSWSDACIIAQVYGDYDEFVGVPFGIGPMYDADDEDEAQEYDESYTGRVAQQAIDHGFLTNCHNEHGDSGTVPYELLDRVWIAMLAARAEAKEPVELRVPEEDSWDEALARLLKEELVTREQVKELTPA